MTRIHLIEQGFAKKELPEFEVGDTVDVHVLIKEGDKERVQVYGGTVIRRRGTGMSATYTVRRIVQGQGVERTFPVHSPFVQKIEVKRSGRSRRARLYFLRDRTGKATRLREVVGNRDIPGGATPAKAAPVEADVVAPEPVEAREPTPVADE
jgi:large subunit ribosomal protein L19